MLPPLCGERRHFLHSQVTTSTPLMRVWHLPIYPGSLPSCHYTCCCLTQLRSTDSPSIASCSPRLDHYSRFEVNQLQIPLASYRVKIKNRRSHMWARSQVQHNTASLQVEGFFFPSANIFEIRPKDQIKKDFDESFIDSPPPFFPLSFSLLPIANVRSSFDSGGDFTPFSPERYGKSLLQVIFSDTLCSLPTCRLCRQLALLLKEVLCEVLGGYRCSLMLKTHLLRSQTCKCCHTHAPCELGHWFQ